MASAPNFTIERGLPLPSGPVRNKYPLADMEVGDSFAASAGERSRISAAVSGWAKRATGAKRFTVRAINRDTIRIWRVA